MTPEEIVEVREGYREWINGPVPSDMTHGPTPKPAVKPGMYRNWGEATANVAVAAVLCWGVGWGLYGVIVALTALWSLAVDLLDLP